jgi:acyl-CoA hydrolase
MSLIAIAHPKFRPWLIDEAKRHRLIFPDQAFFPASRASTLRTWKPTGPPGRASPCS